MDGSVWGCVCDVGDEAVLRFWVGYTSPVAGLGEGGFDADGWDWEDNAAVEGAWADLF